VSRTIQLCSFSVEGLLLAIDVRKIQEVIRFQEMTRVPAAPPVIRGLINLRGQIVTALDLRRRLDLPPMPDDAHPMNVVIRTDDGAISLLVDDIGDVLELDAEEHQKPPENLPSAMRELVLGIHQLKDKLLLVLDPDRVVNLAGAAAMHG
jgi:purine-binding chemotaxis protein CheW